MASMQLLDSFGLTGSIDAGRGSLKKYFKNLPETLKTNLNLKQIADQDLTDPAVKSVNGGVTFSKSIDIGSSGVELTVGASASAGLSIFVPPRDKAPLFDPDLYGDNIPVDASQRYVSFSLMARLSSSVLATPGDLGFGFNGKSGVTLSYYQNFSSGTKVQSAVQSTIAGFTIPGDLDDIDGMQVNSVAMVESSGSLKFSGTVNLLAVSNPLATLDVPIAGAASINAGAEISVGASYEFSGSYQIRVQRLAGRVFRLGFYRQKDSVFDFTVGAAASLTSELNNSNDDLFVKVIQALSSDPDADLKALQAAGLPAEQIAAIQLAVASAVNRSLEIGACVELSRGRESDAMFLYEVDLEKVTPDGRALLHSALEGDLSGLSRLILHFQPESRS